MRNEVHLQERHLIECVRRGVITAEQRDGILATARTMAHDESGALPDLSWSTVVFGLLAASIVAKPGILLLDRLHAMRGTELLAASLVGVLGSLALAALARRVGLGRVPSGILTGGAAMFSWGLGAGVVATAHGAPMFDASANLYSTFPERAQTLVFLAFGVGDLVAIAAAALLGARFRAPSVAAAGALALVHLIVNATRLTALGSLWHRESTDMVGLGIAGLVLVALARLVDRRARAASTLDVAFWLYTVALVPIAIAAVYAVASLSVMALVVPALLGALGMRWERRSLLAGAALAALVLPVIAVDRDRPETLATVMVVFVSVLAVAVGTVWYRRRVVAAWERDPSRAAAMAARSVW